MSKDFLSGPNHHISSVIINIYRFLIHLSLLIEMYAARRQTNCTWFASQSSISVCSSEQTWTKKKHASKSLTQRPSERKQAVQTGMLETSVVVCLQWQVLSNHHMFVLRARRANVVTEAFNSPAFARNAPSPPAPANDSVCVLKINVCTGSCNIFTESILHDASCSHFWW